MTSVEVHPSQSKGASLLRRRRSSLPPEYQDATDGEYVELRGYAPSATTSVDSLPAYDSIAGDDTPSSSAAAAATPTTVPGAAGLGAVTAAFQIETQGLPLIALPFPTRPVPIPVYSVLPGTGGAVGPLAYESLRSTRGSGNCVLVRAGDEPSDERILCSTTYRFGPNRPPRIELLGDVACDEVYEVRNRGCSTRAQDVRTHLGTFQWRYASRAERKAAGGVNSLLVLDLVTVVALAGGNKIEERRRRVAQLVRNEELRTEGSRGSTAGNGGRLIMDLRGWSDIKGAAHQMEVFVIASCITMLKKEVDRRRMHQMIVIMGAAS
ncbi:hypothetical protein JDV02_006245 [Purpureocillium takamizusanense]|uniref:Uncharacterized protein n=1 Tax=Purpureocillium takamizusanense TaxID=2060973 RepID=A0A9Q8QJ49_9HYPO|nr:uncharacterized protein JDV02_006245 [Purpureocillium takamizusanense]UNI20126.1 hypothetical protein JDV02_006245 [Purpureocillium takamizusanense]